MMHWMVTQAQAAEDPTRQLAVWLTFLGVVFASLMSTVAAKVSRQQRKEDRIDHGMVQVKLDTMDERLNAKVDALLMKIEARWEIMQNKVQSVDDRLDDFSRSIRRLHDRMDTHIDGGAGGRVATRIPDPYTEGAQEHGIRSQQEVRQPGGDQPPASSGPILPDTPERGPSAPGGGTAVGPDEPQQPGEERRQAE